MDELKDTQGRRLNYVRISVTDRCNYRCTYCMPAEGIVWQDHAHIMSFEEILDLCRTLVSLNVRKIRFTGGEPLVRRGMVDFLLKVREQFPELKIALTTNASLLEEFSDKLKEVGLSALNISLDTLNPVKFKNITRTGDIEAVFRGIRAARNAGITGIKLNTVLIRGFNEEEIEGILQFAKKTEVLLRLIEFMPLGDDVWTSEKFISSSAILDMLSTFGRWDPDLSQATELDGPAAYYRNAETGLRIGIISAVSKHFCANCNRLRISASGKLRTCLFSGTEYPLLPYLRSGDLEQVRNRILQAVHEKPKCWQDIRDGSLQMSRIGG